MLVTFNDVTKKQVAIHGCDTARAVRGLWSPVTLSKSIMCPALSQSTV